MMRTPFVPLSLCPMSRYIVQHTDIQRGVTSSIVTFLFGDCEGNDN